MHPTICSTKVQRIQPIRLAVKSQQQFCWIQVPTFTGWWYTYPSEKYEFVSWDDDIPN
jgi:hypothetical protein